MPEYCSTVLQYTAEALALSAVLALGSDAAGSSAAGAWISMFIAPECVIKPGLQHACLRLLRWLVLMAWRRELHAR